MSRFPSCPVYVANAFGKEVLSDPKKNGSKYTEEGPIAINKDASIDIYPQEMELWEGVPLKVHYTPGHSDDSVCLQVEGMLFTGDTLIKDVRTVTKLKTGSREKLRESLDVLASLKGHGLMVYPGHEELFELAMHPQQYRAMKSGKAKADFEADLAERKAKKQNAGGGSMTFPQTVVVEVKGEKYSVTIGANDGKSAPAVASSAAPAAVGSGEGNELTSPLEGKFYLVKGNGDTPVKVGDTVKKGQTICYVEAMKTFNAIASEWDGVITEICLTSGSSVAEDDVLMKIKA